MLTHQRLKLILAGFLTGIPYATIGAQTPRTSDTPTLIVFFTVDQMRPDYFDRFGAQFTGGLARLYRGGAVFTNGFQDHALTVTAQGHATTMSGRFPRSTGIVSDDLGAPDPAAPLIGGGGSGASPFRFRGSTLIDWLRIKDIRSRALSVSRKDRGAILPLGRAHQEVYWYTGRGDFTTSTYYHDTLPTWVKDFNARQLPAKWAGRVWTPILPDSAYREKDDVPAESHGMDYQFPHKAPSDPVAAARALADFPWMDELTLDIALDGLNALQLGKGPQTDILAVSLSTTDAVGHRFGPDSKEMHDQILRLDRSLGVFIDSLYKVRDSARIVFALTADHGTAPYPGVASHDPTTGGWFLDPMGLIAPERKALAAHGLPDSTIMNEEGLILVQRDVIRRAGLNPDSLIRAMQIRLRGVRGIARVDTKRDLAQRDTTTDWLARRWAHVIPPDLENVALMVTQNPWVVFTSGNIDTHGSPYDYDAHVPIMFYGPGFRRGTYKDFVRVVDMAPTLAWIAHVNPTERLDGHVLTEAIQR
jgi:arylsulfatase A-like enzyme